MAKKLAALLAHVLVLGILVPPATAVAEPSDPGVSAGVYRSANVAWIRKIGPDTFMYFAGASQFATTKNTTMRTRAWASKSKCAVAETRNIKVVACSGRVRSKKIDSERFVMDPLMDEATLRFDGNRIKWKGQDLPQPWGAPFADPSFGAFAFASVDRWARASGRVLGADFRGSRWSDFGYMSQGAYAAATTRTPEGRYWIDDDGVVHYRFRFEVKA